MGTLFFQGRQNSTGGRTIVNDPIHSAIFGRPANVLPTAGPWAGVGASLAAAKNGYATNNGVAAPTGGTSAQLQATHLGNELAPPAPNMQTPRPVMGAPNAGAGIYGY